MENGIISMNSATGVTWIYDAEKNPWAYNTGWKKTNGRSVSGCPDSMDGYRVKGKRDGVWDGQKKAN